MEQLLKGLDYLHRKHVIHLDLKPENLLLDVQRQSLYLIDFGSAQELKPRFHQNLPDHSSQLESSPEFFAPEVISNGPVGTYTDMWSFGVILYVSLR